MSISTTSNCATFNGNGSTGPFTFAFPVFDPAHVQVVVIGPDGGTSQMIPGGNCNVSADTEGGSVTLTNPLLAGYTLKVMRVVPMSQPTVLPDHGPYFGSTVERSMDWLTMIDQQLSTRIDDVDDEIEAIEAALAAAAIGQGAPAYTLTARLLDLITKGPEVDVRCDTLANSAALAVSMGRALKITTQIAITTNTDLSAVPMLIVVQGGGFVVSGGATLTLPKNFIAGDYSICFTGAGNVVGLSRARIEWFGGKGDGITDNSGALLDTLDAVGTTAQGAIIFNADGNYLFADANADGTAVIMDGYSNKIFQGNGCNFIIKNSIALLQVSNASNIKFRGINFKDTSVDYTSYGAVYTDSNPTNKNTHLAAFHTRSKGIYLYGHVNAKPVTNIDIVGCSFKGFYYALEGYGNASGTSAPVTDVRVSRTTFAYNFCGVTALGYQLVNGIGACQDWTFDDKTTFDSNWHWGVWLSAGDTTPNSFYVADFKFLGCNFQNTYEEHGIYCQGRNHRFIGCNFYNNNSAGIRSYANPGMTVTGCYFEGNGLNAHTWNGPTATDVGQGYQSAAMFAGNEREPSYTETYEGIGILAADNRFYGNYAGLQLYCDKIRARIISNEVFGCLGTDQAGIDLRQAAEGIVAFNTSSGNASDGIYVTSYGGGGAYAGRSDYLTLLANTTIGNAGYGLNIPVSAAWYYKINGHTANGNTAGNYNVLADSRISDQTFTLSFAGSIPATPSNATTLNLAGQTGINSFRAFAGLVVKKIILSMQNGGPSSGTLTIQPRRNGGTSGMGTGPTWGTDNAKLYPNESGLGYVLETENLSVSATTSSDWSNAGGNPINVVVTLILGYSPSTFYQ